MCEKEKTRNNWYEPAGIEEKTQAIYLIWFEGYIAIHTKTTCNSSLCYINIIQHFFQEISAFGVAKEEIALFATTQFVDTEVEQ